MTKVLVWAVWAILLLVAPPILASLYDGSEHVKVISSTTELETLASGGGVWMVQLFDPSSSVCQQYKRSYEEIANVLRGVFTVAAIDGTSSAGKEIASNLLPGGGGGPYPSLYIVPGGVDKSKKYKGDRDAQSIVQALMDETIRLFQIRSGMDTSQQQKQRSSSSSSSSSGGSNDGGSSGGVVTLTSSDFKSKVLENPAVSMVAFVAPWCGYCKQLLPEWEQAAKKLANEDVMLATVDATTEKDLASLFGVSGYPTIKVFPGGKDKSPRDAQDYPGDRTAAGIVRYALAEIDRTGIPKEIPELLSVDVLRENCEGANRICVLAALPHILDSGAEGRNKYRDLLATVSKAFRGGSFSFLWFEGGSQPNLERALEMTFGFPALVALSLDRDAYAVLHGSFREKSITGFLHSITTGRQATIKLNGDLPAIETVEPWDGKDGEAVEEEFSLDDIMGWDDDDEDGGEL